jgi:hypothetical protein
LIQINVTWEKPGYNFQQNTPELTGHPVMTGVDLRCRLFSILSAVLLLAPLLLVACQNQGTTWEREGATQQDFYMDQGQCKAQAFGLPGGNMMQMAMVMNACMQGKGWYRS